MTNTTVTGAAAAPKSLVARFIGIITAPRDTYLSVVAYPKWFGMLALATIAIAVLVGGFLGTKVGQEAWLDAALSSGREFNEQQMQGMQRMMPFMGYVTAVSMLVFWPLILLLISGILYAVFNAAMGGNATFRQVFAVVVHTGPVGVLAQLFTVPLNYFRGTMTSATNLGVLLPMLREKSFLALLLGMIDLFLVWQLIVLSIGLAVLYRRRTQPIATALLVIYAIIAVIVAFVRRGAGA
jgi:Yip1-like protein